MKGEIEAALLLFALVVIGAAWAFLGYHAARPGRVRIGMDAGAEAGR